MNVLFEPHRWPPQDVRAPEGQYQGVLPRPDHVQKQERDRYCNEIEGEVIAPFFEKSEVDHGSMI